MENDANRIGEWLLRRLDLGPYPDEETLMEGFATFGYAVVGLGALLLLIAALA